MPPQRRQRQHRQPRGGGAGLQRGEQRRGEERLGHRGGCGREGGLEGGGGSRVSCTNAEAEEEEEGGGGGW